MIDPVKICYDDFYKFLVSASLVGIIIIISVIHFSNNNLLIILMCCILFILLICAVTFGLYNWWKKQKVYDELLYIQLSEKQIALKKLELSAKQEELAQQMSKIAIQQFNGRDISAKVK